MRWCVALGIVLAALVARTVKVSARANVRIAGDEIEDELVVQ
jgi:hypothetical protein